MRLIATILLSLAPIAAIAAPPTACPYNVIPYLANVLTPAQRQAMHDGKPNGDPVVAEAILRFKNAQIEAPRTREDPVRISWAQAKALILIGAIRTTVQSPSPTVELVTAAGKVYVTNPPHDGDLTAILNSVDTCFLFIARENVG